MTGLILSLEPLISIKLDSVGLPEKEQYCLQGSDDDRSVTLLLNKVQVQMLVLGIEQLQTELRQNLPGLSEASALFDQDAMRLHSPCDPLFKVTEMSMGYDLEKDLVILIFKKGGKPEVENETITDVRFWCSRSMIAGLSAWAQTLVSFQGVTIQRQSGDSLPLLTGFSPKNNGHKS